MHVNEVAAPYTISEAVAFLKRHPQAIPCTAGTRLLVDPAYKGKQLNLLALSNIKELQTVNRTDRFIDIGACVSLNRVLKLPNTAALDPLKTAILTIGSSSIRNRASLAGNIGSPHSFGSTFPALNCMEAAVEIRSLGGSRWIRIHELISETGLPLMPPASFISRIRLPIKDWSYHCTIRQGDSLLPGSNNISLAALANVEKKAISEIHIVLSGAKVLRLRNLEMNLTGKRLPLAGKDIEFCHHEFMENAIAAGFAAHHAINTADTIRAFLGNLTGDEA